MRTFSHFLFATIACCVLLMVGCESSNDPTNTDNPTDTTSNNDTTKIDPRDTAEIAEYELTIYNDWSKETHPANFPEGAHFSWLGGGTHNSSVSFWKPDELASAGMKEMAETGVVEILADQEVGVAITNGTAWSKIFEKIYTPEQPATAPGWRITTLQIHKDFPLVTLATMLGPSPDWFVGVSGLSLRKDGKWLEELSVDLPLYDGGTKEGVLPVMGGTDQDPPNPISLIAYDDFLGFYVSTNEPHIVGKMVFKRK